MEKLEKSVYTSTGIHQLVDRNNITNLFRHCAATAHTKKVKRHVRVENRTRSYQVRCVKVKAEYREKDIGKSESRERGSGKPKIERKPEESRKLGEMRHWIGRRI